jgi:DNA-binding LacI/PurR family transcriptional regulator
LKLRRVPLVFADVGIARPCVSNIRIDYLHGIRQAVQHLAAFRHQKIAFISGPMRLNKKDWSAKPGDFAILIGSSSDKVELKGLFTLSR